MLGLLLGGLYGLAAAGLSLIFGVPKVLNVARGREDGTRGLPAFVRREFEAYLRCGILSHGFLRLRPIPG